jgi:hypothetical protein
MVRPCSSPASEPNWQGAPKTKEHAKKLDSKIAVIGIDIGKNSAHIAAQDWRRALVLRQKRSRGQVEARLAAGRRASSAWRPAKPLSCFWSRRERAKADHISDRWCRAALVGYRQRPKRRLRA